MPNTDQNTSCNVGELPAGNARPGFVLSGSIVARLDRCRYLVQPTASDETCCCELAIDSDAVPEKGRRVLISRDQFGNGFITAILPADTDQVSRGHGPTELVTTDGARATRSFDSSGEVLQVLDRNERIMFEYRPGQNQGSMALNAGNITLNAGGRFEVSAGEGIRMFSGQGVDLGALKPVRISAGADDASEVEIGPQRLNMSAKRLDCSTESLDIRFEEGRCVGKNMFTRVERMTSVVRSLEVRAKSIVERAGSVFRQVAGVSRLNAKRVRTVCQESHDVVAERVRLDGRKAVKLQGDRIDLG